METSILKSVKKVLGIDESYDAFDEDILMHINSVFSTLNQLGVGPIDGFEIVDDEAVWDDYILDDKNLNSVKTYVYLRVRLLFDPPGTSYHINAIDAQIKEIEYRLVLKQDIINWVNPELVPVDGEIILDGGSA